ncbi:Protein SRN2 [Nakaseomyces bracarensis]|uniref:Protein SRN2 n=1 Tax=Nakaseomyces bracarensis TaxID=273131 RepID=A0ABR4NZX6_9SACH
MDSECVSPPPPALPMRSQCEMIPMNPENPPDMDLPANINLLSSQEILDMINHHRDQIQLYVARLNPLDTTREEVLNMKEQFKTLESKFAKLEDDKLALQDQIAELVILESEYTKKFQDLQSLIRDNFGEPVLKAKLESRIKELEQQSDSVELKAKKDLDLDDFVSTYMALRQDYHLQKEKLITWESQGRLRI